MISLLIEKETLMKKALPLIAVLLIFLVGVGVLLYPLISSAVNNIAARQGAEEYDVSVEEMDTEEIDRMFTSAEAYNESLHRVILTDPFDEASYGLISEGYTESLNVDGNGLIGYIDIPKIDVYLPIYHGTSIEVLSVGAGHLEHTALPIGGESTHCVISAHSAFPTQTFFDYLEELEIGDEFYIHVLNRTLKYVVDDINVVLPDDTKDLYIIDGEDHCTLLTCTPYSVNTHRLLVRGTRAPYTPESASRTETLKFSDGSVFLLGYRVTYLTAGLVIGGFVLFVGVVVFLLIRLRRGKKNEKSKHSAEKTEEQAPDDSGGEG